MICPRTPNEAKQSKAKRMSSRPHRMRLDKTSQAKVSKGGPWTWTYEDRFLLIRRQTVRRQSREELGLDVVLVQLKIELMSKGGGGVLGRIDREGRRGRGRVGAHGRLSCAEEDIEVYVFRWVLVYEGGRDEKRSERREVGGDGGMHGLMSKAGLPILSLSARFRSASREGRDRAPNEIHSRRAEDCCGRERRKLLDRKRHE